MLIRRNVPELINAESKVFKDEKISVPYGFAVTAASMHFIKENVLDQKLGMLWPIWIPTILSS